MDEQASQWRPLKEFPCRTSRVDAHDS